MGGGSGPRSQYTVGASGAFNPNASFGAGGGGKTCTVVKKVVHSSTGTAWTVTTICRAAMMSCEMACVFPTRCEGDRS